MKTPYYIVLMLTALLTARPGSSADVAVLNGDVSLSIVTATAGQQPEEVSDATRQLEWTTLEADLTKKIMVQTNVSTPNYSLSVQAILISEGDGTSNGVVDLSTSPGDLIVNIPANIQAPEQGTCFLRYTASATASGGAGSDNHTVTFTITDQ